MIIAGICIGVLFVFLYIAFIWKINWIQDLTAENYKNAAKRRISTSRKIGKLPPVYPNGWFGLLDSTELQNGQVKHVAALGENFAVFRTESGAARIFDAYCPHLGANMAENGEVKGEDLECSFHLWRFCGKSGKCISIPYSEKIPTNAKTKVWDCIEVNGKIFVWYHAESIPPYWWPESIDEISNGTWRYQGRNEFYFDCHIREIPENGADWAHLNALHGPSTVAKSLLSKIVYHQWSDVTWSPNYKEDYEDSAITNNEKLQVMKKSEKHKAKSLFNHQLVIFKKYEILKLRIIANQIGPGYVQLILNTFWGPICIVQTVTPVKPLTQKVTHLMYSPFLLSPYAKIIMIGECLQFLRDAQVWNNKKHLDNPILIKEEKAINVYRRWYRQFFSENSPTYESCGDSLDW